MWKTMIPGANLLDKIYWLQFLFLPCREYFPFGKFDNNFLQLHFGIEAVVNFDMSQIHCCVIFIEISRHSRQDHFSFAHIYVQLNLVD